MAKGRKKIEGGEAMVRQPLFIPSNLWNDYLTVANYPYGDRKFDGKIWKVMEYFLELYRREQEDKKSQYDNRLTIVEDRLAQLENEVYNKKTHEKKEVRTFAD